MGSLCSSRRCHTYLNFLLILGSTSYLLRKRKYLWEIKINRFHLLTKIAIVEPFGNSNFIFLGQLMEKSIHGDGKSVCQLGGLSKNSLTLEEPQKKKKGIVDH